MKNRKLFLLTFIFLLAMIAVPQSGMVDSIDQVSNNHTGSVGQTNQVPITKPQKAFVNASVTRVDRNVTVLADGKIDMVDTIVLKIHDNKTKISSVNFTVPTFFTKNAAEVKFFSQFEEQVGLDSQGNTRTYTTFKGRDLTVYTIDIKQNGTRANSTHGTVYLESRITVMHTIAFSLNSTGQKGVFSTPLAPMFLNLEVEDAQVGIGLSGSEDEFLIGEINKFENHIGAEMPILTEGRDFLRYNNLSHEPVDIFYRLNQDKDRSVMKFRALTPLGDTQGVPTTVAPYAYKKADRVVRISQWGKVYVKETITIIHLGAERNVTGTTFENIHQFAGRKVRLDDDAVLTDAYDNLGSLELKNRDEDTGYVKTTSSPISGKQDLDLEFRNPIYGGQTYTFSLEYQYNSSDVLTVDDGLYRLNTSLFSDFNTSVWDMNVRFQLPAGSSYVDDSYSHRSNMVDYTITANKERFPLGSLRHVELEFNMQNVSYIDNDGFHINYRGGTIGFFDYLITIMTATLALIAFAYLAAGLQFDRPSQIQIEKEKIPVQEIEKFYELFRDKHGAEQRLVDLRKKRRKSKITKKDYEGQVKSIRRRIRDLNPQLEEAADELSDQGRKYENIVDKILLADQRQVDIRRNARNTQKRYKRGEISKKIYQRIMKEYQEDISKQDSIINSKLVELLEITSRYKQQ